MSDWENATSEEVLADLRQAAERARTPESFPGQPMGQIELIVHFPPGWEEQAPQRAKWEAFERKELAARRCPYSGEDLTTEGEEGPEALSCAVCDCFGYALDDSRIGGKEE